MIRAVHCPDRYRQHHLGGARDSFNKEEIERLKKTQEKGTTTM